jgi:hypothetical protein
MLLELEVYIRRECPYMHSIQIKYLHLLKENDIPTWQ